MGPVVVLSALDRRASREPRAIAELFLDPEKLVVLRDAFRAGWRAGLDLPDARCDDKVGDQSILGLPGAVRDDGAVARVTRDRDRFERLGEGSDLVELDQDRVRDPSVNAAAQDRRGW